MVNYGGVKMKTFYKNLCSLVYNLISVLSKNFNAISPEDFYQLSVLSVNMYWKVTHIEELLRTKIYTYYKCFLVIDVSVHNQCEYYKHITTLLQENRAVKKNDVTLSHLLHLLLIIINNLFKNNNEDLVVEIVDATLKILQDKQNLEIKLIKTSKYLLETDQNINVKRLKETLLECRNLLTQIQNKSSPLTVSTAKILYLLLNDLVKRYMNMESELLSKLFDENVSNYLFEMSPMLVKIFSDNVKKCSTCLHCNNNTEKAAIINAYMLPRNVYNVYVSKQVAGVEKILPIIRDSFEESCNFIVNLKADDCSWDVVWQEVGIYLYNLCVELHRVKSEEIFDFTDLFVKYLILLEGTEKSNLKNDVLGVCFNISSQAYMAKRDYEKALLFLALIVLLCESKREHALTQWVCVKSSKLKENDSKMLRTITIPKILINNKTCIRKWYPNFNLNKELKRDMLLLEIAAYKKLWPSKMPMFQTCEELKPITDLYSFMQILVDTWSDCISKIPKQMYHVISNTLDSCKVNDTENCTAQYFIYLAHLYYVQYCVLTNKFRQEHANQVNETMDMEKPFCVSEDSPIPHEECDIFAMYQHLSLKQQEQVLQYLDLSLKTVRSYMGALNGEVLKNMKVHEFVTKIVYEYRLHNFTYEYLEAGYLCLEVAKTINDPILTLQSVANIIAKTDVDIKNFTTLLDEAECQMKILENDDGDEKWTAVTYFYINVGCSYYRCNDVERSLASYTAASNSFNKLKSADKILQVELEFYEWLHMCLPCNFNVPNHDRIFFAKPHLLILKILEMINECGK